MRASVVALAICTGLSPSLTGRSPSSTGRSPSGPAPSLQAQQPSPSQADVVRDLQNAEALLRAGKYGQADAAFTSLADTAHRLSFEAEEAEARCGLGEALLELTRYPEAQTTLQQCLDISERLHSEFGIGRAANALSRVAYQVGRTADAASYAKRAITAYDAAPNPRGSASARLELLHVSQQSVEEERAITEEIVGAARRDHNPGLEADALHAFGDRLFNDDQFDEAFRTLTRARDIYHDTQAFRAEGTVWNSLGRVYRAHGRLDEALKCQQQALALHEKYGGSFELMQSHNAVAVVLNQMGNLTGAQSHYEQALAIAKESSSPRIQDFLNANIASLQIDLGEYDAGARTLEGVIARGVDTYPSVRYEDLAFAYLKLHRNADALATVEKAVAVCGTDQLHCLGALKLRALIRGTAGDDAGARADVRKALEMIEGVRGRLIPADFLKQNFNEMQRELYSAAIAIAFNHQDERESLDTAELASSRAFLDLLAARTTAPEAHAPASGDLASPASAASATANDLVAIASRLHSTVVVYWPADDGLFVWVVARDGTIAERRVEITKARLVELIRATATASAPGRPWRQLYEALIAPIRDRLPRTPGTLLTIVPHGVVANVSFAALQARDGRYLLEDYALHYAPAGAVLQFTAGLRHPDARRGAALLVADPSIAPRSELDTPLPPLPGAREEVARIATLLPPGRVTVLQGSDAAEPRVVAAAAGSAIVHLATHAIVRDDRPNESYLAFGPGDGSSTGLLTARDVYDLRLRADLVVLSACRSGGGPVTGDGIASFARAFIYAGAPSLVVSLWDVADAPAGRLLPAFYQSWFAGASKARSLRRAQLQLLADLRGGRLKIETRAGPIVLPERPVYWAGFVLIGEPE